MQPRSDSTSPPAPGEIPDHGAGPAPTVWRRAGRAVERLIGSDVHPGEWQLVLLFFANLFLLLTAYYILKVIREPLILLGGGAVSRSYARGLQAVLLAVIIPGYSLLANRVEPDRLVKWIMGFFVACLGGFYLLGNLGVPVGFSFFVWLGIFSTLAIAQFWSLATDLLTEGEGKRLFPLVAVGGTVGGIFGAQIAARAAGWLDPYQLMIVAAVLLAACMAITHLGHEAGLRHRVRLPSEHRSGARDRRGGFTLILHDRYLMLIAASVFILNLINTTGDFILAELVNSHAKALAAGAVDAAVARRQFISTFYGDFQTAVSLLTALAQILVVSRAFKVLGVGPSLFVVPLIAMVGYGTGMMLPGLVLLTILKVVENSADYSLQNTVQQALFLPASRDAKYKAKAAIDTLGVRMGDLASTGLVLVGVQVGLGVVHYALANFVASVLWLLLVVRLVRRHRLLTSVGRPPEPRAQPVDQGTAVPTLPVTTSGLPGPSAS
jgi:ATP:ADP antiporter, AAA family